VSKMQKPKSRLGRGLSSLISVSELPVEAEVEVPADPAVASRQRTPLETPAAPSETAPASAETPPAPPKTSPAPTEAPPPRSGTSPKPSDAPAGTPRATTSAAVTPSLAAATLPKQSPNPGTAASAQAEADLRSTQVPRGTDAAPTGAPLEIPIEQVSPNPHQPRRHFNDAALSELAASLKSNGIIQPIVVRQVDGRYELVAGERRLRAAKLAGMATIPAIVRDLDSFTQAQMALVENIHREDLNPIERASAYRSLIEQLGLTQAELANRLGEDRSTVTNFLRLLELAEAVRMMIRDGRISLGHAKVLAGVSDSLEQERLANLVVSQGLSVRNLERLVQSPTTVPPAKSAKGSPSAHLQDLEKSFARQLGMRVQIRAGANKSKGRVVIHYGSLDQFDLLLEKLGIDSDAS